jgi:hypothetical protein
MRERLIMEMTVTNGPPGVKSEIFQTDPVPIRPCIFLLFDTLNSLPRKGLQFLALAAK